MALEPEFLSIFTQPIKRYPAAGIDMYGKRLDGPAEDLNCHIQGGKTEVTTGTSETAIAEGQAWMAHHPTMTTADTITLPGETRHRALLTVQTVYDEDGPHHTKITYGG